MLGAFAFGALFVNAIGDYRNTVMGRDQFNWSGAGISEIMKIDFAGNFKRIISGEQEGHELENAMFVIEAADRLMNFDYGFSLWNSFVQRYVPGQIVGANIKRDLYVDSVDSARLVFGQVPRLGTTSTGLADAFQSFWYFGALIFFGIGLVMARWWCAAVGGNRVAQVVIMLCVSAALHAITHTTHHFPLVFVQIGAFLVPALLYARVSVRQAVRPVIGPSFFARG